MPHRIRSLLALVGSAAILSGCASSSVETAPPGETVANEGACAAPTLEVAADTGAFRPGDEIQLTVANLIALCADTPATGSETPGSNVDDAVEEFPVVWLQNGTRTALDVVAPNDGSPFSVDVSVPASATPGGASILISTAELRVEVSG